MIRTRDLIVDYYKKWLENASEEMITTKMNGLILEKAEDEGDVECL